MKLRFSSREFNGATAAALGSAVRFQVLPLSLVRAIAPIASDEFVMMPLNTLPFPVASDVASDAIKPELEAFHDCPLLVLR